MGLVDPTTNGPLTGATITDLDLVYCRPGAAIVDTNATALAQVDSAYGANKAIELDSSHAKGEYRVDWPDAAFASGVAAVTLIVQDGSERQVGRLEVSLIEDLGAAEIADAVWDETATGHTDAGKAGQQLWTDVDLILADTGSDGVVLADDAITSAKFDESTAFPVSSADTGATQIARVGADGDTLETLSDQVDAITVQGSGAISYTVTIQDGDSNALDGAEVWVTSDEGGSNIVAGTLTTDANGQATFMLDAGTYYLWQQLSGYNFTNPATLTVSS